MTVLAGFISSTAHDSILDGNLTRSMARSLIECAVLSYKNPLEVEAAVNLGNDSLIEFEWFEAIGRSFDSQAFACIVPGHVILAFRGTRELRDFLTDALLIKRPLRDFNGDSRNGLGSVHLGFQRALNGLWSNKRSARKYALSTSGLPIDKYLGKVAKEHSESQLWLTGHSLGAALATIAAARIQLTQNAPFNGRVGGLVTVGSPRVLDHTVASNLTEKLGSKKIFRIYRSIDPVPAVPYFGFKHASGERRAFVSNKGILVMGARKKRKLFDTSAAFLRTIEDSVGSALPGQHRGFGAFVSDHDSEDYLTAVGEYKEENKLSLRDYIVPHVVPLLKLLGIGTGGWAVIDTTGIVGMVSKGFAASAQLLQTGAELMLVSLL